MPDFVERLARKYNLHCTSLGCIEYCYQTAAVIREALAEAWMRSRQMGIHDVACTETCNAHDQEICPTCELFAALREGR